MGQKRPAEDPPDRMSLRFSPELTKWIKSELERTGLSRMQFVSNCVAEEKRRREQRVSEVEQEDQRTQDALIAAIEKQFFWELACATANVSARMAAYWLTNQGFAQRVETARQIYLQRLQLKLIEMGSGDVKGGKFGALVRFLEAHDPNYGRVRAELVLRILQQEYKDLMAILAEELGATQHEALHRALLRYEERRDLRLSSFTE